MEDSKSIVPVPVTGSLTSPTVFSCRDVASTNRFLRDCIIRDKDGVLTAGYQVLLQLFPKYLIMDADESRTGVTFGIDLYIPCDALEMAVDLESATTVPLRNVQDVFGMVGRRASMKESRILQGRDPRSIRVLIPDSRGLDQNFHDVTVVDMGDLPESHVSITELSELAKRWPLAVINYMRWREPELEEMRRTAKVQYRKRQPAQCNFCGILIKCDMFQHVARCHLELTQLWRCPVSWCTAWKGTPQDLMDHIHDSHNIPERVQDIRLETPFPPWTVTRQVYTESLTSLTLRDIK